MSDKYTYADVIIDPDDPRVEIKKGYYYYGCTPKEVLEKANSNGSSFMLSSIDKSDDEPFWITVVGTRATCIIRKKEPEKKYVPFDLTKEEDRAKLRGAWVRISDYPSIEYQITSMNEAYVFCGGQKEGINPGLLSAGYEFVDGSPCGRLVEE